MNPNDYVKLIKLKLKTLQRKRELIDYSNSASYRNDELELIKEHDKVYSELCAYINPYLSESGK